jgi:hypothetical protein
MILAVTNRAMIIASAIMLVKATAVGMISSLQATTVKMAAQMENATPAHILARAMKQTMATTLKIMGLLMLIAGL